ncbi:MAG TPA: DUF2007 domain-containing protein [Mucilaginibacter sp.]|jgi:hypothetical protein|nr:DUF2007 domain-containing protein [Mucilaginibacter sp.]
MDKWFTVLASSSPQKLWIIRGRLESEGIECFIKDEWNVQSDHLYSNELGTVKLQVLQKDEERVLEILKESGYLKDEPVRRDFLTSIDKKTANFVFLKKLPVTKRIIVMVLLASLVLGTILYFSFKPSTYDMLTNTWWCVNKIYYRGRLLQPNTQQALNMNLVDRNGNSVNCETLNLMKGNYISLPGINSDSVEGYWKYSDSETIFINVNSLKKIYNGTYYIDVSYNRLILKSKTTEIYANRMSF